MTIEQALRYLARRGTRLNLRLEDGHVRTEAVIGGRKEAVFARKVLAASLDSSNLSVLTWQLVSIVQQMQREEIMGNVHRRFFELISPTDLEKPVTLKDLVNLASIVDDELARVEKSIGFKREDGRALVEAYGQTETKDRRPATESIRTS